MKKSIAVLIATLALSACDGALQKLGIQEAAASPEHQVGNGGGGVCFLGTCLTMAEAGLRIVSPEEEYFILPPTTARAVKDLLDRLPMADYRKEYLSRTIGDGKTYKLLTVVEPDKLEIIRQRYASVLAKHQSPINMDDVRIFAFASGDLISPVTYLLPDFFTLESSQQAKILIHEHNVRRGYGSDLLERVLEFDSLSEELLKSPARLTAADFRIDRWEYLNAEFIHPSFGTTTRYKESSFINWLAWLKETQGLLISKSEICEKSVAPSSCMFNVSQLTVSQPVPPAFVRVVQGFQALPPTYSLKAMEIPEAAEVCDNKLKAQSDGAQLTILYPVKTGGSDYQLAEISCESMNGEIRHSSNLRVNW